MTWAWNVLQSVTMNTYNVYQSVALLSVLWIVAGLMLHVAIVSTPFNFSLELIMCL